MAEYKEKFVLNTEKSVDFYRIPVVYYSSRIEEAFVSAPEYMFYMSAPP
ncbi:MAG: hypothetical protein Q4F31_07590 [Eubacteriales bacterium]|nr:hypothetical protein [Eubacteriales bacterium]